MANGQMQRRAFLLLVASTGIPGVSPAFGQVAGPAGRLILLKDLVEAIGAAADSLKKLAGAIEDTARKGLGGYDVVKARLVHRRLVDISARLSEVYTSQIALPTSLKEYADVAPSLDEGERGMAWREQTYRLQGVLSRVLTLAEDLRAERSDFVLEDAYSTLVRTLGARSELLGKLVVIPAPTSPEELAAIRKAGDRYAVLIQELRSAREQMNVYIKAVDGKKG